MGAILIQNHQVIFSYLYIFEIQCSFFTTTFSSIQIPSKCIFSYALLFVQLEDQSMAFIQFLERMNELGGDEIKERDCDEWFWKCDDENI